MICKNCGSQIDDKAVICVHCGVRIKPKKPFYKKWWFWAIVVVFAMVATAPSENQGVDNPASSIDDSTGAHISSESTFDSAEETIPPEEKDEYAVVDRFIESYNTISSEPIVNISQMDIHGADYKVEFRLNAFRNAVGKKGTVPNGTIEAINYGVWDNDEFRVYAFVDSFDAAVNLYITAMRVDCHEIVQAEIDALYQRNDGVDSVPLGYGKTLTGYINAAYANGGVSGYKILLENFSLNFMK